MVRMIGGFNLVWGNRLCRCDLHCMIWPVARWNPEAWEGEHGNLQPWTWANLHHGRRVDLTNDRGWFSQQWEMSLGFFGCEKICKRRWQNGCVEIWSRVPGLFQKHYLHQIAKGTTRQPRINATFRTIVEHAASCPLRRWSSEVCVNSAILPPSYMPHIPYRHTHTYIMYIYYIMYVYTVTIFPIPGLKINQIYH